jgi:hypothetical protein
VGRLKQRQNPPAPIANCSFGSRRLPNPPPSPLTKPASVLPSVFYANVRAGAKLKKAAAPVKQPAGGGGGGSPSLGNIFAAGVPTLKKTARPAEREPSGSGSGGSGIGGGISLVGVKLKKTGGPRVGGKLQTNGWSFCQIDPPPWSQALAPTRITLQTNCQHIFGCLSLSPRNHRCTCRGWPLALDAGTAAAVL